jgi:hypothetical protein
MSQRVQLKRSSILGKRPNNQYLEPGELALNTNQSDPGLFFETNTGDIAKVGPTHIGINPPTTEVGYGPGETWLDSGNGTMNIWVPVFNKWMPIQAPLFGGATTAIFVGSEFPEASDDLTNDGIARPFASLNRAMMEVARRSILSGRFDDLYNAQFTVVLLPGRNIVYNEPGVNYAEFEQQISGFEPDQAISQPIFRLFNPMAGGLLVPRGTSIIALDLRKTEIRPTYYPFWTRLKYEFDPATIEPRTSILKWTGNSYFTSFTFRDKVETISVSAITGDADDVAVLRSARPHGFRSLVTSNSSTSEVVVADRVTLSYPESVPQLYENDPVTPSGDYYVDPIDANTFRLRRTADASIILRRELPQFGTPGANPPEYLVLTYPLTTHHRLSALKFATTVELNEYYSKIQRAFSLINFSGTVNNAEVAPGETNIVTTLTDTPSASIEKVENASPYILNCSLRSDWGMCGGEVDGELVTGFRSALFCNFTTVSLQNDTDTYEVYDATAKAWIGLKERYSAATNTPIGVVTNQAALDFLVSSNIKVEDIRFFFRPKLDIPADDSKSSGLTDPVSDTRNYSILTSNGGFSQVVSSFAIGVAINYWALSGGTMAVSNANSNFGGIAIRAEGFRGIGTAGGAEAPDQNFIVKGIRRPSVITRRMVEDANNVKKFYFNARVVNATTETVVFDSELDTSALLPYTLRPGSYFWAQDYNTGTAYKVRIRTALPILSPDKKTLYVESGTNEFYSTGTPGTPGIAGTGAIIGLNTATLPSGSGYVSDTTYNAVSLTGGTGSGATANITISGGEVSSIVIVNAGLGYNVGDILSAASADLGGGSPTDFSITVSAVNTGTPGTPATPAGFINANLSLPYLRRFIDPRPKIDRQYSLWIGGSVSANRAPEYGYILRFSQNSASNLLRPNVQLDPGQNGGWNHLFQVIDTRTKAEGDNPNGTEPLIVPSASSGDYYVTLLQVDGFHPWLAGGVNGFSTSVDINYPKGAYATYNQRVFYPMEADQAVAALKPLPTDIGTTVWTRSKNLELCQDIEQAWMHADGYTSADDPMTLSYSEEGVTYTYPRGVQFDQGNYVLEGAIDVDNGTSTLGILSGDVAQTSLYDPWWSPSKMAMTRLLSLLGFSYTQIDSMLQPQLWTSRNLAVAGMPQVGTTGYAQSTGQWGIEFNRPSSIRSGNHTWEWSGYLNYAKGLPRYQTSQLSVRERFDAMFTSMWGGIVSATGTDDRDEFVITGKAVAGGSGATLLTTGITSGQTITTVPLA